MEQRDPQEWAELLRRNWEERARSPYRDFYVDSRPDFQDPAVWERYAKASADLVLQGVEAQELARMELLEIGCGVGRLVPFVAPRVSSYTGFDIAPGMVEEAKQRHGATSNARFFLGDGLEVPPPARDRTYDIAFALAVFIHCPRPVIASLMKSACSLLRPGGQIRFQLLADPSDPTGLISATKAEQAHRELTEASTQVPEGAMRLLEGSYYMGEAFRFEEAAAFLTDLVPGRIELYRPDLSAIYGVGILPTTDA